MTSVERWERRERKLRKRREDMKVSGIGLKKVLLPLLEKKARNAERASGRKPPPGRRKPVSKRRW